MSQKTAIDWFAFRYTHDRQALETALKGAFGPCGDLVNLRPRKTGWQGYESSADVCLGDMVVGLSAHGGQGQRGWGFTSITGRGCEWIQNWDDAQDAVSGLEGFEVRRADIALTTYRREVSHESMLTAYRAGQFSTGGRPPKCTRIEPERPEDGRTINIGNRERDKFLRGYEKGYQLAQGQFTHLDGFPVEDIYRVELELKAKTCALPADLVDRRDQYFAGSYPYMQTLLADVEPEILVMQRERGPQLDLARVLTTLQGQYGNTLFTALTAYRGDIGAVWSKICGHKHNQELVRAGVLLVEHE
jgi:phage replication initiation protein